MNNEVLITKLLGGATDNNLPIANSVVIRNITPGTNSQGRAQFRMCVKQGETSVLKVTGGYFMNSSYEDIGDTLNVTNYNINDMEYINVKPTSDDCEVVIGNKYNVKGFLFNANPTSKNNMVVYGEELYYMPELKWLEFNGVDGYSDTVLRGTLSLSDVVSLNTFVLVNSSQEEIMTDIISNKSEIENIYCYNCPNITTKLQDFADASNLKYARIRGNKEENEWNSSSLRSTGYVICGTFSINDSVSVDNFLINMANLVFLAVAPDRTGINIFGAERTSASDAAVATLKAKVDANNVPFGKIRINGVEQ